MAGHSHAANVRFRKDRVNAAKAKAFAKVARMITVAAKLGGGDPITNPRLRLAIDKARAVSMPKDNIERAIKKGTGGGDDGNYEEILYEGYAPAGVAVMLEVLTDKRSRTAPELRKIFDRSGGNLGSSGSVAYMFDRRAVFLVPGSAGLGEEALLEIGLEGGADDVLSQGEDFELRADPSDFEPLRTALERAGVETASAEVSYVPKTMAVVTDLDDARRVMRCLDALEDNDDVQNVFANYEFADEVLEALQKDVE